MTVIQRFISALKRMFVTGIPESMATIAKRPRSLNSFAGTSRLYVLEIDFPLDEAHEIKLNEVREYLQKTYAIDWIITEPGMRLRRFDDF